MVNRVTTVAAKCEWKNHQWLTTHYANGTGRQKMICDICGTHSTIAKIEATNRLLRGKRIADCRNGEA